MQSLKTGVGRTALTASVLALILSACSTSAVPTQTEAPPDFAYVATVEPKGNSQAELEAMYGGTALVYRPEAGLTVLGFTDEEGQLTTAMTELNADVQAPAAHANGFNAWASGFNAWASGFNAWASGFNAWASGFNAWASGFNAWASGTEDLPVPAEAVAMMDMIGLEDAHALSINKGAGVKVAVIDSGLDLDHPLLTDRLAPASQWKDYVDGDTYPEDEVASSSSNGALYGHGTAVAGIIAQVAPNATILPIRVLEASGNGQVSDIVSAIDHAIANGADIINLSLGTNHDLASVRAMVDYATSQGVYLVIASGNAGQNPMDYPAEYAKDSSRQDASKIISVGSVDASMSRSSFSNYSEQTDFLVPGEGIFSAYPVASDGTGVAGLFTGTSFATPIVSGMVALQLGDNANANVESELANASSTVTGSHNGWGMPSAYSLMGGQ